MQHDKKENAPTNVPAFDRARKAEPAAEAKEIPLFHCSTNDSYKQAQKREFLESVLPRGAANAVPARKLAALLGISPREVGQLVHEARRSGVNILSSNGSHQPGYFLPGEGTAGREETERFVISMSRRGSQVFAALKAARAYLEEDETPDGTT